MKKIFLIIISIYLIIPKSYAFEIPDNLYKGIIAEDCSGNYQTYLIIASVVRNRLSNGLNSGLVALRRKGLDSFVERNRAYVMAKKGVDLKAVATQAIDEVFNQKKDYAFGATHYEHTQVYPTPKWAKNMRIVKVVYPNTKKELTLWR